MVRGVSWEPDAGNTVTALSDGAQGRLLSSTLQGSKRGLGQSLEETSLSGAAQRGRGHQEWLGMRDTHTVALYALEDRRVSCICVLHGTWHSVILRIGA